MSQDIREGVAHLWDEVNAIDVALGEVAKEFDGEDPLRPVMRGVLENARRDLSLLHEFFSGKEAVAVTQPSDEALQLARIFDKGVELYEQL
jgi:nitrogenase molybdenum-iron protein alpha/beta subunit